MVPGLGKQTIVVGSAAHCDIRLGGPGVAAEHARIVHQGGGALVLTDLGQGPTTMNGAPVQPGSTHPFDLRTQFAVGQALLPNAHPAVALMLMEPGKAPPSPGELRFGREPAQNHVVIHHPNVSGRHATFTLAPLSVTDTGSTSGTWVDRERIAPNQPRPLEPHAFVALGPVVLPVALVIQLGQALGVAGGAAAPVPMTGVAQQFPGGAAAPGTAAVPANPAAPAGGGAGSDGVAPRPKHKTVIGQVLVGGGPGAGAGGGTKSIGRTPAQYIIQQRLRHAQRQLANTKRDITTIAIESGFSSHSHLTACFHKHLGTCPSAFRKAVHFVAVRQGSDNS
jgi:pSer/pThr/pTyr-binding forkhead associated (FHA) protein